MLSKYAAHIIWFILLLTPFGILIYYEESLRNNISSWVSSISAFITLYAVIFSIIESRLAKKSADQAKYAADQAKDATNQIKTRLNSLATTKEIAECETMVHSALESFDQNSPIPIALLGRILNLYNRIFHEKMKDSDSTERLNASIIKSYIIVSKPRGNSSKSKDALISILEDLGKFDGSIRHSVS